MKKTLLCITFFLFFLIDLQGQTLIGTAYNGGDNAGGTINEFSDFTNDLTALKSFESFPANPLSTNFVQASNGMLYGMTSFGGNYNSGIIFLFDPLSSTYKKLYDFDYTNGGDPYGSLIQASNGKLYGMAIAGGSNSAGVIFSFDPSSSAYTKLYDFDNTNGANPDGNLMQASDGKLYGMTNTGGSKGVGVIFSFDPVSSVYTKVNDFDTTNGANPYGNLIQANDGKLYGMTSAGGGGGYGVIFSFDLSSSTYMKLYDFNNIDGGDPRGSLLQANNGKLYGITRGGGLSGWGVTFSFDLSTLIYTKLAEFSGNNGANPYGSLIQASDGKLYGMAYGEGSTGYGVIFSFDLSTAAITKLKDFDNTDGANPLGSLIQANNGNLYGMSSYGGGSNVGIIFSFDPSSSVFTKLTDIGTNQNGSKPSASLLKANDGKLYGMTINGGSSAVGVIFSFDPISSTYTKLKDFGITDGANPTGTLIQAGNGKLYGITSAGGSLGYGVIFSFDPSSSTYTKLKDFDGTNGASPAGSLLQANDGKLYGMTSTGGIPGDRGSTGFGVIFSFDPSSLIYTNLMDFYYNTGYSPDGNLIQASDGKLYGMTSYGGSTTSEGSGGGYGDIFSFDLSSSTFTDLRDFDGVSGGNSNGSLIQARDGKLYGTTILGGSNDHGVIFSFNPSSSAYTDLMDLNSAGGSYPYGNLLQAGNGKLYGNTISGGADNEGVVFSYDPSVSLYSKIADYNGANGANPSAGSAFIEIPESGPLPVTLISFTGKNNGDANQLLWKVANEEQLNYYELQRSNDGQNFVAISQITTTGSNNYSYNDDIDGAATSVFYYRLKIVDKDGNFIYSNTVKLSRDITGNFVKVNPNPFKDGLVITVELPVKDQATFVLTDINGRQLFRENKQLTAGTNVISIDETNNLAQGTYLLTIIRSDQFQTIKVVKGN